jgi:CRP/FNR family cyclic AMP-dependent transcriptional regulator
MTMRISTAYGRAVVTKATRQRGPAGASTSHPIFEGCTPRAKKRLSGLGTRIQVSAGRPLIKTGGRGAEVLIVLAGTAICEVHDKEVARFGPGDFFGEVATLDGGPRTATVVAGTDMDVLVLNRSEFETLVKSSPEVAHRILTTMAHRLRHANAAAVA